MTRMCTPPTENSKQTTLEQLTIDIIAHLNDIEQITTIPFSQYHALNTDVIKKALLNADQKGIISLTSLTVPEQSDLTRYISMTLPPVEAYTQTNLIIKKLIDATEDWCMIRTQIEQAGNRQKAEAYCKQQVAKAYYTLEKHYLTYSELKAEQKEGADALLDVSLSNHEQTLAEKKANLASAQTKLQKLQQYLHDSTLLSSETS